MKKLNVALIVAVLALPSVAFAEPAPRLVVTHYNAAENSNGVQTQSLNRGATQRTALEQACLPLPTGDDWCVPRVSPTKRAADSVSTQSVNARSQKRSRAPVSVINVPAGVDTREAVEMLKQTGWYQRVEVDVVIKSQSWNIPNPNDSWFAEQPHLQDYNPAGGNHTGSSVTAMWQKLRAPERNIDVIIMDGSFRLSNDINYNGTGMNFVYRTEQDLYEGGDWRVPVELRSPGFLESELNPDCPDSEEHGMAVSGFAAATINNNFGIAGTVNGVTLHPLRVLKCKAGYLSDAAAALFWVAGEPLTAGWGSGTIDDLPAYTGKPGIINMSLGGRLEPWETEFPECPFYMQQAIDAANDAGFTVVVAAGNEEIDARFLAPAMCDNVITVGATNPTTADMAPFSNYGPAVDVMAQGQNLIALSHEGVKPYSAGTSFAAPIVTGIIAAVKKDFEVLTPAEWTYLVRQSVNVPWGEGSECDLLGCGTGQIDALKLYNNAELYLIGKSSRMEYTLAQVSTCRQGWVRDNLTAPDGGTWCDLVDVKINGGVKVYPNENRWELYKKSGDDFQLVKAADSPSFRVNRSEVAGGEYVYRACEVDANGDPLYCTTMQPVDTSELANLPAVCQ